MKMDLLMAAIDEDEMRNKMVDDRILGAEGDHHHHQEGLGFLEETTKMMINKEDDEMKKNYDQGFLDLNQEGRGFQETSTNIKKRRFRQDDDDNGSSCHGMKKKQNKKEISLRCLQYATPEEQEQDLPIKFRKRITALGGSDVALVIQKLLFKTDVSSGHNRLSIPMKQIRHKFLTPQETQMLMMKNEKKKTNRSCPEMEVMLIEPSLHRGTISLRMWEMKKPCGNSTSMYVLVGNWNSVAWRNALREDETVQLWSFRINSNLCFALVKRNALPTTSSCFLFQSS